VCDARRRDDEPKVCIQARTRVRCVSYRLASRSRARVSVARVWARAPSLGTSEYAARDDAASGAVDVTRARRRVRRACAVDVWRGIACARAWRWLADVPRVRASRQGFRDAATVARFQNFCSRASRIGVFGRVTDGVCVHRAVCAIQRNERPRRLAFAASMAIEFR